MSLNCLKGHIGIEGCGGETPASDLYINRLPGIEMEAIDKIATADQVNFQGVWEDIEERAVRKFRNKVVMEFNKRYKLKTITQAVDIEKLINTDVSTASGADYRGYALELNRDVDDYVASNMQSIYIKSLPLYLSGAVNTTVKIFDLDTETELFSQAVTGVQGWNTVSVNQTFSYRRLYVVYNATNVTSVEQDITKLRQAVLYGNDGCHCLCYYGSNLRIEIRGASSTIADPFNITYGDDTFGLSGIFSVQCSYDNLICNNMPVFETAFWYLCGAEFCFERSYTSRINKFTPMDQKKAKELEKTYNTRFEEELITAIGGIDLDLNDLCLVCNEPIRQADARV